MVSINISYEIKVIDNASDFNDYLHLKKKLDSLNIENLTLFRSKINTGFGGGNMLGVQLSNSKYYAFVNNDTTLQNDCISIIFNFLENNPNVSIASPQQFNEKNEVQKSFDHFLSLKRELFGRKILEKLNPTKYPKREKRYSSPIKVQSVPGSFLVVRAQTFCQVGGFDTNIFLYYEETDLCYRISKLKEKNECYLIPEGRYTHFKGQSTNKNIEIKKELKISLLYVLKKNSGYTIYQILRWWLTIKSLFKLIIKPKSYKLLLLFLKGAPLTESLKLKQSITKQ